MVLNWKASPKSEMQFLNPTSALLVLQTDQTSSTSPSKPIPRYHKIPQLALNNFPNSKKCKHKAHLTNIYIHEQQQQQIAPLLYLLMHHQTTDLHIRKEPKPIIFSDVPSPHKQPQVNHIKIKIPPFPISPHSSPKQIAQTQIRDEPFSPNQLTNNPIISTPHRRPVMAQSSDFYPSLTLKSNTSLTPSSRIPVLVATRRITLRLIHHSCHPSWLKLHLKLFMLISFPSLYLFTSPKRWPLVFYFFCVVLVSACLLLSCNMSLPRLPSIRLFLARTLCVVGYSGSQTSSKGSRPVVWSIGSKQKTEKLKLDDSGSWVKVYSNGDVYEGEFHKGKCSGSGVYYYHMSGRYEGDWIDEKYDGYGIETWAKGSRYRGQYRQGLRHGVGVYRSYTGDVFAGEWSSGQCHGCGSHTCADGSSYVGEFKWGVKHGLGHYHFRNGDRYAGEYFADKMHGFGVYNFGNGHRYEGAWHEGRRQGLGMYTFRNGETQSGHWQNGVLHVPSTDGKLCRSPSMVDHSKVVAASQEARRVAEKAVVAAPVGERVDRAIAAANKAATAARVASVKAVQTRMHQNNINDFYAPTPVV